MATNFNKYLEEKLKNPEFRQAYENANLQLEQEIMLTMIKARLQNKMTQKDLAEKTGVSQTLVSLIEREKGNPSIKILQRIAEGMNMKLKIEFIPNDN